MYITSVGYDKSFAIQPDGTLESIIPTSALYTYSTSVNAVSTGAWSYLVTTFSQSDNLLHIYLNGVEVTYGVQSAGSGSPEADSGAAGIGQDGGNANAYNLTGMLDEVRMSNTSRTAAWIATEYHNQSSPGAFFSVGQEQNMPVPNPTLVSLSLSPSSVASGGAVTITATLSGVAPSGGASVSLLSSNPTALPVPTAIAVTAGQASGSTTATAASVASAMNVTVTGTYNNSSQTGTTTVTPTIETITIITNPPNLTVTVDNVNYTAPQSFHGVRHVSFDRGSVTPERDNRWPISFFGVVGRWRGGA